MLKTDIFKIELLFIIVVQLINLSLSAQDMDLRFNHLSSKNGVSVCDSKTIVQDREGFIWIGSSDGLSRYDGLKVKVYRKIINDPTSIQHNQVNTLFVDSYGDLWIGTDRGGLSKYNKEKDCFKNYLYNPVDSGSIQDNWVSSIIEDSDKRLWISTFWGLNLYNREKDCFIRFTYNPYIKISDDGLQNLKSRNFPAQMIKLLNSKKNQKVLFSDLTALLGKPAIIDSMQKYLLLLRTYSNIISNNKSLDDYHIRILTPDKHGNIWIGYSNSIISKFNPRTGDFNHYEFNRLNDRNLIDFFVTSILINDNKIWVSTRGAGICIFDTLTLKWSGFDKIAEKYVNYLLKDTYGKIWIACGYEGLISYDPITNITSNYQHHKYDKNSLSSNALTFLYEDWQKILWISCIQDDVDYLIRRSPFKTISETTTVPGQLTNGNITAITEDDDNNLWIGFYNTGGIDIINRVSYQKKFIAPNKNSSSGLGEGSVQCIFKDSKSNIWVGTYLGGLQKFDKKKNKFITFKNDPIDLTSISGNDIRRITEDKEGNIWVAVHGGGICMFDEKNKKFVQYRLNFSNRQESIANDWVFTVYCDNQDNIWIGSVSGISIIRKNSKIIRNYNHQPGNNKSLSNDFVSTIFQDSKGNLWFGTNEGLNLFDANTETFKIFSTKDGLPNDNITCILEDNKNCLWIGTYKGLSKFSVSEKSFRNFDILDGLVTDEFKQFASYKNKNGEMFFGGRYGLNFFYPDSITINRFQPPLYLTDFKLFNQSVEVFNPNNPSGFSLAKQIIYSDKLILSYDRNVITFEFVALNYIQPEKNQYAYKMEGFDKQWNYIGNKHDVTFTNLPPGNYTFRMKASNNDAVWNETGTKLKITITPPWWRTNLAFVLYCIITLLLLYFFRRIIIKREKQKQELELERIETKKIHEIDLMKLRFFTNISHEFRTPLTLILAPIEKMVNLVKDENLLMQLKLIYRNAYRLLRLINQIMDFRKLESGGLKLEASKGDIVKFISDVSKYFIYEAKERKIDLQVINSEGSIMTWFDKDKLDKILYNLIANAFKFTSDNGKITVSISSCIDESQKNANLIQHVKIVIEDTGIGIKAESLPKIFDRFYQADTSYKNLGTGIGLSLSKELIELHDGEILVNSEPEKGTRVIVLLPLKSRYLEDTQNNDNQDFISDGQTLKSDILWQSEIEGDKSIEEKKQLEKLPILLIIEDNSDLRLFIKHEFKHLFRIAEASDGEIGYQKATSIIPDLIICDIMMPKMDGMELCKGLRADEKTSHIPIILLTARSSEDQVIEGLETGADDYITKPFSSLILKARVKNLIESRKLLRKQYSKPIGDSTTLITPTLLDQKFLQRSTQIIEFNINNPEFDALKLAKEIGMSRAQLYRKLKALTDNSVNEFIRNIRLKKASELLANNSLNVSETAYAVGFLHVNYFSKCFSEYFGMSPLKYVAMKKRE